MAVELNVQLMGFLSRKIEILRRGVHPEPVEGLLRMTFRGNLSGSAEGRGTFLKKCRHPLLVIRRSTCDLLQDGFIRQRIIERF